MGVNRQELLDEEAAYKKVKKLYKINNKINYFKKNKYIVFGKGI